MTDVDIRPEEAQMATAILILRALDGESTTAADVADAIERDPQLSKRLVRLARSPMFGVNADDLTPRRAVVLVGFKTVRSLAVLSAARSMTAGDADGERWSRALMTGIATEQLARRAGVDGADGLVAGLLARLLGDAEPTLVAKVTSSIPPHIVAAIDVEEHVSPGADAPILRRLVHAGMALGRCLEEFAPGIPSSADLATALESTTLPGLVDRRLATDVRRGVDLYADLAR